jgi:hypothetical protein
VWHFYCYPCDIADDYWALLARIEGRDVADVLSEARQGSEYPKSRPQGQGSPSPTPPKRTYATIDAFLGELRRWHPQMLLEERNEYLDPATKQIDLVTVRYKKTPADKKEFLQLTPYQGGWVLEGLKGDKLPLFNRTQLQTAKRVLFVEGEKCVRIVRSVGIGDLAATTIPGGAKNGKRGNLAPLAGKDVYVWPDNDEPGSTYAAGVIEDLRALIPPPAVYLVDPQALEMLEKQDIADYIAEA